MVWGILFAFFGGIYYICKILSDKASTKMAESSYERRKKIAHDMQNEFISRVTNPDFEEKFQKDLSDTESRHNISMFIKSVWENELSDLYDKLKNDQCYRLTKHDLGELGTIIYFAKHGYIPKMYVDSIGGFLNFRFRVVVSKEGFYLLDEFCKWWDLELQKHGIEPMYAGYWDYYSEDSSFAHKFGCMLAQEKKEVPRAYVYYWKPIEYLVELKR